MFRKLVQMLINGVICSGFAARIFPHAPFEEFEFHHDWTVKFWVLYFVLFIGVNYINRWAAPPTTGEPG